MTGVQTCALPIRRPGSYLVGVAWATLGAEVVGAGPRGGGTSTYQGGGPARPSLRDVVGDRIYQYMVFSSEGSVSRQL